MEQTPKWLLVWKALSRKSFGHSRGMPVKTAVAAGGANVSIASNMVLLYFLLVPPLRDSSEESFVQRL